MTFEQSQTIAEILGGLDWKVPGGDYIVIFERSNRFVALTSQGVVECASCNDFLVGEDMQTIYFK